MSLERIGLAFPLLPWHERPWRTIEGAIAAGRLGHAILLAGPVGVGKRMLAMRTAAAVLCNRADPAEAPCGDCRDCHLLVAGSHPGFRVLRREEERRDISIEAVRELCAALTLTSHDARTKVALVDSADDLNRNGVNALLKTLEEPPPGSLLLLLSQAPMALPATLRSRCSILRIPSPPESPLLDWLETQHPDIPRARCLEAMQQASGSPLRVAALLEDEQTLERFHRWDTQIRSLVSGDTDPLAFATEIGRENASEFVDWLYNWHWRQLRAGLAGEPPGPIRMHCGNELVEAARRLRGNVNPLLVLESLLSAWAVAYARARPRAAPAAMGYS